MNIKLLIGIMIGTAVIIGGSYLLVNQADSTSKIQITSNVKVVTGITDHDWGTIGINDGKVHATYSVKNAGTETLKLFNLETSCMCTTATVKVGDKTSPEFGMHTKSNYVSEVAPGETAEIVATFDPAFHGPSGVGQITRQIMVETNDKSNPRLEFTAEAEVVSKSK